MWEKLLQTLSVRNPPEGYRPVVSSPSAIERFQDEFDFEFPASYLSYLKVFGPGFIGEYVNIYAPDCGIEELIVHRDKSSKILRKVFGDDDLLSRIIFFADTLGGDLMGWDPEDVLDPDRNEYRICLLPRNDNKMVKLDCFFLEFVTVDCLECKRFGGPFEPTFEPHLEKIN